MGSERSPGRSAGQASLELIAGVPLLVLAGLVALQLLAAGYTLTLVDGAAEAGALALAAGREPEAAAAAALPGWASRRLDIEIDGGNVRVTVTPPAAVPGLAGALAVSSSAWARRPEPE